MNKTIVALALLMLILGNATTQAVVTFDWVTVGNPGNAPDQLYTSGNPTNLRFGSVDYTYRISKYEVTNEQYTEFLNAVDPTGTNPFLDGDDPFLYNPSMSTEALGGITFDSGAASGSKYSSKPNMGNKPVNWVSFYDAMRFVNWLENGQPNDGTGTETGVYTIGNGFNETRAPAASFFIPSEDEWYKAAYHQPAAQGGDSDHYWLYATRSNSVPTMATANAVGDISNPGANVANYDSAASWNGQDGNVTTVGSAGPQSASFYGTFDQSGNVWEWNEAVIDSDFVRGLRGGGVGFGSIVLPASLRGNLGDPFVEADFIGFRVASIGVPEPATSILLAGGLACVALSRRLGSRSKVA